MAKFVGGVVAADGRMIELGLWEKEERQHTRALIKIYQHHRYNSTGIGRAITR